MRTHLQGIALLAFLVVALWGMTRLAAPSLNEAFGDDGMGTAVSADVVDLVVGGETLERPLDDDERIRLQAHLLFAGYLDDVSEVDGIIGEGTREAMAEAAIAWGLDEPTDREFLTFANALAEVSKIPADS